MFKAIFLTFALAACGGSSSSSSMEPVGSGGSSQQSCSEQHQCINGSCSCTAGPKKGNSCCDPDDSTCSSSTRCDNYCQYCT
jgi:hypothetical protein